MDQDRSRIVKLCISNQRIADNFCSTYNGLTGMIRFPFYRKLFVKQILLLFIPLFVIVHCILLFYYGQINPEGMGVIETLYHYPWRVLSLFVVLPTVIIINLLLFKKDAPQLDVYKYNERSYVLMDRMTFFKEYIDINFWNVSKKKCNSFKLLRKDYYRYGIIPKGIKLHQDLYAMLKKELENECATIDVNNLFAIFSSRCHIRDVPYFNQQIRDFDHLIRETNSFELITTSNINDYKKIVDFLWEKHYGEPEFLIISMIEASLKELPKRRLDRLIREIKTNSYEYDLLGVDLSRFEPGVDVKDKGVYKCGTFDQ